MPFTIYDSGDSTTSERRRRRPGTSIALGIVSNNIDLITQGKVKVRVPSIDREIWVRLVAPGAANGRGLLINPQVDDEVLIAFHQDSPNDGYLIGGLWSTSNRMPVSDFTETLSKRVLKTGIDDLPGHTVEFDDLLQSITITTSTSQEIKLSLDGGIVIDNLLNSIRLGIDGSVDINGLLGSVSIDAAGSVSITGIKITLDAPNIEIKGANISITGANVKIN